jgi:RNA polymerase sigma factor (sigma-70 family)
MTQNNASAAILEEIVRHALAGDRDSLKELVQALQDDVMGVALRMLGDRHEAEDAAQEILVRVVTRLSSFDGRSSVRTWVFRVAMNYILDVKRSASERMRRSFEELGEVLDATPGSAGIGDVEESLFIEEVKEECSLGMLQCLDAPYRAAFLLGHVFELSGDEAAAALEISPTLYRKRLQHARTTMVGFMEAHCGLVRDDAPCRCSHYVEPQAQHSRQRACSGGAAVCRSSFVEAQRLVRQVERAQWAIQVHRGTTGGGIPADLVRRIMDSLDFQKSSLAGASAASRVPRGN